MLLQGLTKAPVHDSHTCISTHRGLAIGNTQEAGVLCMAVVRHRQEDPFDWTTEAASYYLYTDLDPHPQNPAAIPGRVAF